MAVFLLSIVTGRLHLAIDGMFPCNLARYLILQGCMDFSLVQGEPPNQPKLSGPASFQWKGRQRLDLVFIEFQEHGIVNRCAQR
jgi:hypothetical protein